MPKECEVKSSVCFIVPQELPSVLSLVYSNIPPIKKGTDSRLGFGFRLGEHADFQMVLELGPQKETKPLGDQDSSSSSFNKRHVSKDNQKTKLRKTFDEQQQQEKNKKHHIDNNKSMEKNSKNWLETWAQEIKQNNMKSKQKPQIMTNEKPLRDVSIPLMNSEIIRQLQQLYNMTSTQQQNKVFVSVPQMKDDLKQRTQSLSKKEKTKDLSDVSLSDEE